MFECTSCGAQMRFFPKTGKLVCSYCNNTLPVSEHPDDVRFREGNAKEAKLSEYDVTVFTCPQCGGEILSMENQASEFCSYCGASVTLEGRLSKANCPKKILPFRIAKEDVQSQYKFYVDSLHFVPDELKNQEFQEKFCGIYMPYWSYRVTQKGPAFLKGVRTKGDATEYCDVNVDLDAVYDNLCFDASMSFDDTLSNAIGPFSTERMTDFSPAYLMGFYADTPDVDADVYEADAREEANKETLSRISLKGDGIHGMRFTDPENEKDSVLHTLVEERENVLLPVWFLTWRSKGKKGDRVAYAVVNGNGRNMKAEVPVDLKKCLLVASLITIPLCALLFLVLPAVIPATSMLLSACLLVYTMNLYEKHMAELLRREAHLDDVGYLSKMKPEKLENREKKKKKKGGILAVAAAFLITILASALMGVVTTKGGFSFLGMVITWMYRLIADNIRIILATAVLIGTVLASVRFAGICKVSPDRETFWQSVSVYVALAAVAVIYILNPVADWFYYGGMLLTLGSMLLLLYALLTRFNLRCSHEVPNFLERKEVK